MKAPQGLDRMLGWLLCALLATDIPMAAEPPTAEQLRFFETNIRPVLVEHCQKCHGPDKEWAGLRLDSRSAMLRGGDSGPAIVPGLPEESLLIQAVRQLEGGPAMPPEDRLGDGQIADLVRWIEMGAPFPENETVQGHVRDPNHWSFQPLADPALPEVADVAWVQSPIDRFILARLEQAGRRPTPAADKRTLIRRVTFDLTGLPPTPEEIDVFLADEAPDAYARLVDRLLGTSAYGERWGRHWLDVARYADSNGLDENIAHGNAWRYRDYVVDSINRDKPFDRFIVEQLAGDLLPFDTQAQRHEQLIATGFISIGPKVLAEVNESKMRMDIVDEQIDTFGRVFLGLTLGCARCHDHKFDPIDTVDYYGLAGVFKSTRTMETYTKIARWHEHLLPSPEADAMRAEHDAQLAAKKLAIEEFVAAANQQVRAGLAADAAPPENLEASYPETTKADLAKLREELATLEKTPPDLPAAMGVGEDQVVDVAVHVRGNPLKLGDIAPRHTPPVIQGPPGPGFHSTESGRRQLAEWLIDERHPLTARVLVNRVWRWHFGEGLVRTTDNFGLLGEAPSHPDLLDWLARRFVADGWSLKSLHRLLLNSSVYRQGSQGADELLAADPDNRLFGRANLRRLEAEEVRDALLAVSGQLDRTMGGSLLKAKNRTHLFDHTSIDLTDYASRRRSLYLPVIRNNVYDVFQLLDFPDPAVPSGDRATTTVAPQALLMMNSELVMQAADGLAARLLAESGDDAQRLRQLHAYAYGREITDDESRGHLALLTQAKQSLEAAEPDATLRRRQAWSLLCHVVLAANEFIYIR
jgi:mono/diheme cytochrome c family protein